jgi:hypothetical protein
MSQQLDLEFIQKPILSRISISGFLILLVSFWLGVFTWQTYQQQQVKLAEITTDLQKINQQAPKQEMIMPIAAAISSKQLTQLAEDFNVLATPWNELLDAIEQSDMPDIALLGLDPSVKKQQVILTGEAKNLAMILQYINKLAKQANLSQVYLQKHHVNETSNEKPVTFSIIAKWDNATFSAPK